MFRLILKEIKSSRWFIGLVCLGAVVFTFLGNPFSFRGNQPDASSTFFMFFFFILGLRSYSGELKDDTIGFLYSRPIRWWQILLAKLLSVVIVIALILTAASLTYILTVSDQYRPFIADGLSRGIPFSFIVCGFGYVIGFVVSILMPGMALAFVSYLAVLAITLLPFTILGQAAGRDFRVIGSVNAALLVGLGAFVSTILVARRLPKLGVKERWLTWIKLPALGIALACLLAAFHFSIPAECLPGTNALALSPNGRWALHSVFPDAVYRRGKLVLMDTRTGQKLWSAPGEKIAVYLNKPVCAWAEDSSKFAYVTTCLLYTSPSPRDRS